MTVFLPSESGYVVARDVCQVCSKPARYCLCDDIVPLTNQWPLCIVQDQREARHALGTALIAQLSLQSVVTLPANLDTDMHVPALPEDSVLVYPSDDAQPIECLLQHPPRTLVFLDGSWRRSRKMIHVSPQLQAMPCMRLSSPPAPRYRIRKAPDTQSLSTLEAIVYALAVVDGPLERWQPLLACMDKMIARQIDRMGSHVYTRNY